MFGGKLKLKKNVISITHELRGLATHYDVGQRMSDERSADPHRNQTVTFHRVYIFVMGNMSVYSCMKLFFLV